MSAQMQVETNSWKTSNALLATCDATKIELESLLRNQDHRNLVAPLREAQRGEHPERLTRTGGADPRRTVLALQEQWQSWLLQRELFLADLKRGKEFLKETRRELAALRARLQDWPGYERVCGRNPLPEYMQTLATKAQIAKFLPGWLKRRQTKLRSLNLRIERCAKQNGLEHLV